MDFSNHETQVDTRARLREQRKRGWRDPAVFFGLGLGAGCATSFSVYAGTSGFWSIWATAVIAYGLGGLTILVYWWLADLRRKPSPKEPNRQS
ncbi:MAG: hypothetical protein ACE5K8_04050 [Candidatus Zixiibacteriota bacterium]